MDSQERYKVCKLVNIIHLVSSKIGDIAREDIEYIGVRGNVRLRDDVNGPFFNWDIDNEYDEERMKESCHSDAYAAFDAARKLEFRISFVNQHQYQTVVRRKYDEITFKQDEESNDVSKVSNKIMRSLRMEHRQRLQELPSCGMNFKTLENMAQSNFMMNNCKAPINDPLFRFIIRSRTNTIMTRGWNLYLE
jgi:hypothetical protein